MKTKLLGNKQRKQRNCEGRRAKKGTHLAGKWEPPEATLGGENTSANLQDKHLEFYFILFRFG